MTDDPDGYFNAEVAATYDAELEGDDRAIESTVEVLAELAGDGAALEFAIGTGRVALPLLERGVPVNGIELSEAMLSRLREKPRADEIETMTGSMTDARLGDGYALVYLVFNTIMNLTDQQEQVACFRNAAAHLRPGGAFVVEVIVPRLQRLSPGQRLVAWDCSEDHWGMDEYDVATQRSVSHHLYRGPEGVRTRSMPFRYVWPAELDLMAQLAGMELAERWEDWHRAPFTNDSTAHVSVWRKRL